MTALNSWVAEQELFSAHGLAKLLLLIDKNVLLRRFVLLLTMLFQAAFLQESLTANLANQCCSLAAVRFTNFGFLC